MIKLGQNVLVANNVLELKFDKYGIISDKKILKKDNMKKIKYSTAETTNDITQNGFVQKFLSSIKQKMYGNRQKKTNGQ